MTLLHQTDCILERSPLNTKTYPAPSPQAVSGVSGFAERSPPSPLFQRHTPLCHSRTPWLIVQ
ncbi:MAG: hypothetical protein ABI417_06910 [Coleofasciculaceae cyanobacterium]